MILVKEQISANRLEHISVSLAVQVGSVVAVPSGDGLTEETDSEVNPEASTETEGSRGVLARLVAHNPSVDHPCCFFLWYHLDTAHVRPEEGVPLSSWPDPLVHLKKSPIEIKHSRGTICRGDRIGH